MLKAQLGRAKLAWRSKIHIRIELETLAKKFFG